MCVRCAAWICVLFFLDQVASHRTPPRDPTRSPPPFSSGDLHRSNLTAAEPTSYPFPHAFWRSVLLEGRRVVAGCGSLGLLEVLFLWCGVTVWWKLEI
ncbi:hypothetical protein GUJ93_ZPchr0010g10571 [Zizania palustris]|uniref:Secreted protein n=1 Tax=Zizania palustris TaxID=103762 RepID=A0A8J5SZ58_ZIZPA|nr:hypothetical protein GUJ93_ZPchr0010g10571 [Zizania palustris]